jgi:hypothetical protein
LHLSRPLAPKVSSYNPTNRPGKGHPFWTQSNRPLLSLPLKNFGHLFKRHHMAAPLSNSSKSHTCTLQQNEPMNKEL